MTKSAKERKERWEDIETQAWNELSKEGDLGEVRFAQRCFQIAKRLGWDDGAISIMVNGKPLTDEQKRARAGKK